MKKNVRHKTDQADAVVRVTLRRDDFEGSIDAIKHALHDSVAEIDRVNAKRRGKHKLGPGELAFFDRTGHKEFVFPASGEPQWHPRKEEIDPANFPNFAYVVATDERGEKIVVRIEFEYPTLQ